METRRASRLRLIVRLLVIAALAQAIVAMGTAVPLLWRTVALLLWTGLIPGYLLVRLLIGPVQSLAAQPFHTSTSLQPRTRRPARREPVAPVLEMVAYAAGAGLGVMTLVMLLLSYLPGEISPRQLYIAFDLVLIVLAIILALRTPTSVARVEAARYVHAGNGLLWWWAGLALLLTVATGLRLVNLGYAEFHGDEARAVLRAAAVIQGYEDVLMLHKKGPLEILVPTVIFALNGQINEASARLPFALTGLAALLAVFLLGARLFGWMTGWVAAMLLAVDGYLIGFARIVQYQSVVVLTSVLVLLLLYRLVDSQTERSVPIRGPLILAAFLWATGLLAHYEAALIAPPVLILLIVLMRGPTIAPLVTSGRKLLAIGAAVVAGCAVLALFYAPFFLHPQFSATYTYLVERRIGDTFPYNNLADFFNRTTLYSTTYYVGLLVLLTVVALGRVYRRGLGTAIGMALTVGVCAGLAVMVWRSAWLTANGMDVTWLFFTVMLGLAWILPGLPPGPPARSRVLWLWFGLPFLFLLFFTAKPRTHVYVFFVPWVLLASAALVVVWRGLAHVAGERLARLAGMATAGGAVILFGFYAYWYFVHAEVEVLRTWQQNRPAGYWTAYETPDNRALFGFPLANGWKVVGQLYADGVIAGDYATNEVEFWAPAWYTRGELRCEEEADWFFRISNPQPDPEGYARAIDAYLAKDFHLWGQVYLNEQPRLGIYRRSQTPFDIQTFRLDGYAAAFDATARPDLALGYPVIEPPMQQTIHANLGDLLWLEGYDLDYDAPLEPGETFWLTLYWRGQRPIADSYKVFNQSYYGDGVMVAQRDGYPVCGSRGTWLWDPGELIADVHRIEVKADAPPGLYPLYTGMYIEETFERLTVLGPDGQPVDDQVHLGDIRIGEE